MSWKQINRDPFARTSLMRRVARRDERTDCYWCGQIRKGAPNPGNLPVCRTLYVYGTERDDRGGVNEHKGAFCGKSCHDSYHS